MYYKVANIELNTTRHSVLRDGKAVCLTPIEFALLEYLMSHPDRLCKRAEIIDRVWGQRFRYDTGTINVHLTALRRKLGFARKYPIETVRAAGFILHTTDAERPRVVTIRPFVTDWLRSHAGDFESKGLVPHMQLDPFVSDITLAPDDLRTMLDGVLAALLPSAKPGTIRVCSQLRLHTFLLTLSVNDTVNELRIPIYGDTPAS